MIAKKRAADSCDVDAPPRGRGRRVPVAREALGRGPATRSHDRVPGRRPRDEHAVAAVIGQVRQVPGLPADTGSPAAIASPQTVPYGSSKLGSTKASTVRYIRAPPRAGSRPSTTTRSRRSAPSMRSRTRPAYPPRVAVSPTRWRVTTSSGRPAMASRRSRMPFRGSQFATQTAAIRRPRRRLARSMPRCLLAGRTAGRDVQILAGRDDPESINRHARGHELDGEPVARHHEDLAGAVGATVEGGAEPTLDGGASIGRAADAACRRGRPDPAEPGRGGARRDAVEHEHVGAPGRTREQPGGPGRHRPGQRQVGDRDEAQLGAVVRRALGEARWNR